MRVCVHACVCVQPSQSQLSYAVMRQLLFIDLKIDLKLLMIIIILEIDLLTKFCISIVYFNVIIGHLQMLLFSMALLHQLTPIGDKFVN